MTIGDYEPDDAFDVAPPDPEQVARKHAEYLGDRWDRLDDGEQARRILAFGLLLGWLHRSGGV
jgi:hypothetical protein